MGSLGEIMQLCRLCLVKDKVNIPIFEGAGDIRKISHKISACLPVKVAKDDKLPKKICDGCSLKLDVIYQFWNTSTASEKQLLEWVNNPSSLKGESQDSRTNVAEHIVLKQEIDNGDSEALDAGEFIDVNDSFENIGYTHDDDDDMSNENIAIKTENDSQSYIEPPRKKQKVVSLSSAESEEDADDPSDAYNRDDSDEEDNDISDAQPTFVNVSDADQQPGPSGVGKSSGDAPSGKGDSSVLFERYKSYYNLKECSVLAGDVKSYDTNKYKLVHQKHKLIVDVNPANIIRDSRRNKYKCDVCDLKFKDYVMLESHKEVHKPGTVEQKQIDDDNDIDIDVENDNDNDVSSIASSMGSSSSSSSESTKEVETISSDESEKDVNEKNVCVYCNFNFKYNWTLAKHLKQHDQLVCKDCVILFKTKLELANHMSDIHKLFPCKICSQKFYSNQNYKNHIAEKHADYKQEEDRLCPICNILFVSFDQLVEHNSTIQHLFKCKVCKKELYTDALLTSHKTVHLAPNWVCKKCNAAFSEVVEFYDHTQTCKNGKGHVYCDICSSPFMDADTLERHVATHFAPPQASSNTVKGLKFYPIQRKAPEFKCNLCNKIFLTDNLLQDHLKMHLTVHPSPTILNSTLTLPKIVTSTSNVTGTTMKTVPGIQIQMPTLTTINQNNFIQTTLQSTPIIGTTNLVNTNPLLISQSNTKLLLTSEDKRCFILTPVGGPPENGLMKYTVTQTQHPSINTQMYQGLPALQPINNFLQPAINQTIVLPPAQNNSQISITNQTYNTTGVSSPNINPNTSNIVFNHKTFRKTAPKTYSSKAKSTPTASIQLQTVQPNHAPLNINMMPSTSTAGTSYNPGLTEYSPLILNTNSPSRTKSILIKGTESSKSTKEFKITKISPPTNTKSPIPALINIAGPSNDTFKPKIFLKPLSQLLQNPIERESSIEKEAPITANETDNSSNEGISILPTMEPEDELVIEPIIELVTTDEVEESTTNSKVDQESESTAEPEMEFINDNVSDPNFESTTEVEPKSVEPTAGSSKTKGEKSPKGERKMYRCSMCGIVCKRAGKLIQHQSKYQCKLCKFAVCKLKSLDAHYRNLHHFKNRCASCDKQFNTNMELQIHKKDVHLCVKCNRCYLDLKKHKTSFTCLNCEFTACDSASLDAHYKQVHRITTRCGPCNSIFYTAESFALHKQEIHFCSKCRTYKMDLNIHKTFCKGTSIEDEKLNDGFPKTAEIIELDSE